MLHPIYVLLLVAIVAYLIGSIPTGYLIVKAKTGQDIREVGSGSTGATNVKRVLGKKWFFAVMVLDAIKGALPVVAAKYLYMGDLIGLFPVIAAVMVIVGHSKPLFLGFKGGKSVASGVGTILALNFFVGLILVGVWAIVTWFSKYVSLGSIVTMIVAPIAMILLNNPICYNIYAFIAMVYVIYLHRENVKRLIQGTENKVRQ